MNDKALNSLARRYAKALEAQFPERLISVVLFGSVAREEATENSDIDLIIVIKDLPRQRRKRKDLLKPAREKIDKLRRRLEQDRSPIHFTELIYTPEEAAQMRPLYLDLVEDAQLLYDRDQFFERLLKRLKASLKALGARRIRTVEGWYWDLKPDFKPGDVVEI